MTAECNPNARVVLQEFYETNFSVHANTYAGHWNSGNNAIEPYGDLLRAALTGAFEGEATVQVSREMSRIDASLRFGIMDQALGAMSDEEAEAASGILMTVFQGDPERLENDALLDIRAYVDKQKVAARLAKQGLVEPPTIDQDALFARITNPENEFMVSFDELLTLSELFDPGESSPEVLIAAFNRWKEDPDGGQQLIDAGEMKLKAHTLSIGDQAVEAGKDTTLQTATMLADAYRTTGSSVQLTELVKTLLYAVNPAGITLYENLVVAGHKELLLEDEHMLKGYGVALAASHQLDKARKVMATAEKYQDHCYIGLEIAQAQLEAGDSGAAIATIDQLATVEPMNFAGNKTEDELTRILANSPRGMMFEAFAVQYVASGAYDKAVAIYQKSRKYPEADYRLADPAIAAGEEQSYLDAVLGFEGNEHDLAFMTSWLTVALLHRLNSRNPMGVALKDTHPTIVTSVQGLIERLTEQRKFGNDITKKVMGETLFSLHNLIGDAQTALGILQSEQRSPWSAMQDFGALITTLAKQGRYGEAVNLFEVYHDQFTDGGSFKYPKASSMLMGWARVHGDHDVFHRFYEQLPEHERHQALVDMVRAFPEHDLHLDAIVTHDIMFPEADGKGVNVGTIAVLGKYLIGGK